MSTDKPKAINLTHFLGLKRLHHFEIVENATQYVVADKCQICHVIYALPERLTKLAIHNRHIPKRIICNNMFHSMMQD